MGKILFVPTSNRDSEMFIPLIRKLGEYGDECLVISLDEFNKQDSERLFEKHKIPFKRISQYYTKNVNDMVEREKLDAIIISNDQSMIERSFVIAANNHNIPTIFIQNGAIIPRKSLRGKQFTLKWIHLITNWMGILNRYLFFFVTLCSVENSYFRGLKIFVIDLWRNITILELRGQYGCTKLAVTGNFEKKILMEYGIPADSIVPIGNPKFDRIINQSYDKDKVYKEYDIPSDKKIVLLTTQAMVEHGLWLEKHREQFTKMIIKAFQSIPDVQLLIKPHPWEPVEIYENILSKNPHNAIFCKNANLYELINAAEILITIHSTTALEALIFNKLVIIVNPFNEPSYIPYVNSGACISVDEIEELPSVVGNIISDETIRDKMKKNREKFIFDHAYKADGKALERAMDLIHELINTSNIVDLKD